ncbi:AraC family transcriptional regulator [Umezawaea sp. Da 62-37]|uniref:AraC family transcriptional regulator n=1 Tax=Umezawaea sp. Da 62-37 TaxID=3075927 RepID=UPI0028F6C651|nr:AraC family transcriptional regulator [Umezawaea sp. Da 62-37]WNV87495.1 AraC family transcriptional regulator [Umezawaea sp. Da 62-37]
MTRVDSMTFALQHADLLRARATAVDFDPHLHGTYSVVAVTSGTAHIWSSRWSRTVRAGDVFFFNPFEVHAGRSAGSPARYDVLYPSEAFLDGCTATIGPDEIRIIRTEVLPRSRTTRELVDALSAPVVDSAWIEESLRQVLRECSFSVESPTSTSSSIARTVCGLVRRDGRGSTRTDDLAREIGVNPSHLVRSFRKTIGIPPQTYVRQVRVARARELICAGFELNDVAQMVDFCDQPHLTREFKKVFGVPPGALSRGVRRN